MPIDAFSVLCAQLTRDLLAIAKFLLVLVLVSVQLINCTTKTSANASTHFVVY